MNRVPLIAAIAAAVMALGIFVYVTDAPAYAGTNPSTCANCHVMDSQYENWAHAGHAQAATCAECHLPHQNIFVYYIAKARTGMHDVYVFSTGQTPVAIRAKPETQHIIQDNCIRCHQAAVENIMLGPQAFERNCWDCHRSVAHGERGISIVPYQDTALYPSK
ncbi:MAG: cytochrome c nitrite reductase small subunit [Anaerolineae bacterium]